ncbi:MAG: DUF2309 domain-containing protein, partial [Magnetococcales bacterium]|nr:DUF2309 domain-containing protein [Magnetococcales bacterium]
MSDHATSFNHRLEHLFHHLTHRLPGQAPIRDFVHHNTLHGYQHLPFEEALRQVRKETGIYGFLPLEQSRALYQKGRIIPEALREEIFSRTELLAEEHLAFLDDGPLKQADIYATALIHDLSPLKPDQLAWQIHELRAGETFQADVPPTIRHRLLHSADAVEEVAIAQLWSACHHLLPPPPHPLISHEPLEDVLWQGQPRHEARRTMERLFQQVGREITLGGLVQRLTGHAPLEEGKTNLQSHLASFLDHGLAAWHHPARKQGFYAAWRQAALHDLAFLPEEMPTWREEITSFPEDAVATLQEALRRSGVAEELWISYLEALALELPGWSGMVLWRHHHEGYAGLPRVHFADYLAVRLLLERLHLHRICHHLWQEEPRLDILYNHFRHREAEFMVRHTLFNESLPESLATPCQAMVARAEETTVDELLWTQLAYGIWRYRQGMRAEGLSNDWVCHRIWPLFRLAQHLGLSARELHRLREEPLQKILACLDRLDDETMGMIWLQAYERTYRQSIFNAIRHGGQKEQTSKRPSLQAVFCMDDREEGFRRHLEEIAPSVETFGAAGFFGVPIYWRGLDDEKEVALCPIVVTPRHAIHEIPKEDQQDRYQQHRKRRRTRLN